MILRNWYNALKAEITHSVITNGVIDYTGVAKPAGWYSSNTGCGNFYISGVNITTSVYDGIIVVGRGTAPPTLDDYKLENRITSGLSGSLIRNKDESGINYVDLTNTSTSAITVSEIGLYGKAYSAANSGSTNYILIERSTFDPITIQPGEIARIEYKININVPE